MRSSHCFFAWLGACILLACSPETLPAASKRPPNVVIIFADDLGYGDIGVFGAKGFRTPHLDRLAQEGCTYRNFYVAQPVCSASRAALLTGCYPNRLGIHGALGPKARIGLNHSEMTMAEVLKQSSYATAIFGKWHLGDAKELLPVHHGFDEYYGLPYSNDMWPWHPERPAGKRAGYPDLPMIEGDRVTDPEVTAEEQDRLITDYTARAVQFIERNREKPFFLYLAHNLPHVPLHVSDVHRGKSGAGLYGDVIEEIDWSVGQVMATLDRLRLRDNTWVIFTSDNGPWLSYGEHAGSSGGLREGKGTSWEGGVRVPCVMRWPGHIRAGTENNTMFMTIDLLPTIAGRVGVPLPPLPIDGMDVWPIVANQPGAKNPHSSYWFYYARNELQAVTSGDGKWKLVLPHTYRTLAGRPGGKDGIPVKYENVKLAGPELYDLTSDTRETRNVAQDHPEAVKNLLAEAEKARAELGDSLTQREGKGVRQPATVKSVAQ